MTTKNETGAPRHHVRANTMEVWATRTLGFTLAYLVVLVLLAWAGVIK